MVDIDQLTKNQNKLRFNHLQSKTKNLKMINDLTEESLVENSECGTDELRGYFNLPVTQLNVLKQDARFCFDEPDSDVDFEEKSEDLRTSDLSENLSQQLWKVYPYMQLGTLADMVKDFSKM